MKNKWIEASREKVVAWGLLLVDTFKELGISSNKVIRNCHIGRNNYAKMKKGEIINADAYVRMTDFLLQAIRKRKAKGLRLPVTEEELKERFWR